MKLNREYLIEYWQRISDDSKAGKKIDWRLDELRTHIFIKEMDDEAAKEEARKRKEQLQQTGIVVAGVAILGLIIFLIIVPSWMNSYSYIQKLKSERTLETELEKKRDNLDIATRNFEQLLIRQEGKTETPLEIIDQAIPDYSDLGTVLRIIGKCADEVISENPKMVIQMVNIDEVPEDNPLTAAINAQLGQTPSEQEVTIVITMMGEFRAIREFISRLKSMRHNFRIEQMIFTSSGNSQILNVTMTLKYYYFN